MDHGQLDIILVDLGFADEDEVRFVKDCEVSEVVDVPGKAFYIPSHC